jgi:hypothetical protein
MRMYTELYVNEKKEYTEKTFRERIMFATPKFSFGDWKEGIEYDVILQQMQNKRFCIYKTPKHFNENSGYKVFDTMDDVEIHFDLKKDVEFLTERKMGAGFFLPQGKTAIKI